MIIPPSGEPNGSPLGDYNGLVIITSDTKFADNAKSGKKYKTSIRTVAIPKRKTEYSRHKWNIFNNASETRLALLNIENRNPIQ